MAPAPLDPDPTLTDTTHHDDRHDVVSPTEAAARLGITPDAVRARLRRGTLAGERVGGDWRVFLAAANGDSSRGDNGHDPTDCDESARHHDGDRRDDRHDADTTRHDAVIAAKDETIASLKDEVAFLRRELETRTDELGRRDVLLREALARVPALGAGENGAPGANGDARTKAADGQGVAEGGSAAVQTLNGTAPQEPLRRVWWAFWRRG
jgi:hypothetical protein